MEKMKQCWLWMVVCSMGLSSAAIASPKLLQSEKGIDWILGTNGIRVVGVGHLRMKQKGWKYEKKLKQTEDAVEFSFSASGGEGRPAGWTVRMPLGSDSVKEERIEKIGRWRRHSAGREAQPVETLLGKFKVVRSPHGDLMFRLPGNENWTGESHESVEFRDDGAGGLARKLQFWRLRPQEFPYEAAARVSSVPFALKVSCPVRNHLYAAGDIQLDFAVTETLGVEYDDLSLEIIVRDWDGRETFSRQGKTSLYAYQRRTGRISLPNPGRGLYFVELRVVKGSEEEFTRTTFAVIPPFEFKYRDQSIFGITLRTGRVFKDEIEEEYRLCSRLGMRYLRTGYNNIAAKFGMVSGFSKQMPKTDFRAGNEEDLREVKSWVDEIEKRGAPIFEFGNEIGHFKDTPTRHILYDRYNLWLDALRAERARRKLDFKIMYGTSARRPDLMKLINDKGIFGKLDLFVVHPGRLNWTPDLLGKGWRFLGLVRDSKVAYAELGHPKTPIYLTEMYTKSRPNCKHSDSWRQTAENAVLNAVLALSEGMAGFCIYQLHEGVSYDENGIDTSDTEYSYGILHRDNSLKPSAIAYETAAEELDGAKALGEISRAGTKLCGRLFSTPSGPMAVLWDRTEGYNLRTQGPRERSRSEAFFHFEPWLENWREKTPYRFKTSGREVTVRDAIGRLRTFSASGGEVELVLTGAPVFVRGLKLDVSSNGDVAGAAISENETDDEKNAKLY